MTNLSSTQSVLEVYCFILFVITLVISVHYWCVNASFRKRSSEGDLREDGDVLSSPVREEKVVDTACEQTPLAVLPLELLRAIIDHLPIDEMILMDMSMSDKSLRRVFLDALQSLPDQYWSTSVGVIRDTRTLLYVISRQAFSVKKIPLPIQLDPHPDRPEANINFAVKNKLYAVVRWLSQIPSCEGYCVLDTPDRTGRTPLQNTALQGDKNGLKMAKLLLSLGANANRVSNSSSWTPLLLCTIGKDSKATAKLLLKEPSVEVLFKDAAGRTALTYAVEFAKTHIAYFILERMIKNSQQQNPLTQDLAESTDEDKGGLSPVHYSVKSGDINLTRMLLSSTSEDAVDTQDSRGRTPLMLAALYGHLDITRLLASRSHDVNQVDNRGHSALRLAIEAGFINVATLLAVDYSADTQAVLSR